MSMLKDVKENMHMLREELKNLKQEPEIIL